MYCVEPKDHRYAWYSDKGRFTYFDWKRNRIIPSKTAVVRCGVCKNYWSTTNRELVAKLPFTNPLHVHDWYYIDETHRECVTCHKKESR